MNNQQGLLQRRATKPLYGLVTATILILRLVIPAYANEPSALNEYAATLIARGDYDKALESLQKAFSLNSLDPQVKRNLAEAYAYVGQHHLDRNEYEESVRYFDNARELFPEDARYATLRGISLYFAKQYDAAIIELERALLLDPRSLEALFFLGRARYDGNDISGAVGAWEKALLLQPENQNLKELLEKTKREELIEKRMEKGFSSRFSITYDTEAAKSTLADGILDALEEAYNRIGSTLDHYPAARVPVILYTKRDFRTVTEGPDWSGGTYDGKIRLPIGGAEQVNQGLRAVIFHEYAHVVVKELTHGNCPTWLNEGVAEIEGRKERNIRLMELPKALKKGELHSLAALSGVFTGFTGKEAVLAYEESYSAVNYLASNYGWHLVREILVQLGKGVSIANAVQKGLGDTGTTLPQVEAEWREYLRKTVASPE